MGVGAEKMALLRRDAGAFAVGDLLVRGHGGGLTTQRQFGGTRAVNRPRVEQIQIAVLMGDQALIGQSGKGVFCCEAGNVKSRLHGALNSRLRKIGGAGVATALSHIDGDAQGLVAVALNVLQFALANRHAQAAAFRGFCGRVGGA